MFTCRHTFLRDPYHVAADTTIGQSQLTSWRKARWNHGTVPARLYGQRHRRHEEQTSRR